MFKRTLPIRTETKNNPGLRLKQANSFSSLSKESTEIEFLDLLQSLVQATQMRHLLETGTGKGLSAVALAFGIKEQTSSGGLGHLTSVESDSEAVSEAQLLVEKAGLADLVAIHHSDSLRFIESLHECAPYDFVYFDSSRRTRVKEFELLRARGLVTVGTILAFHDTSPHWNTPQAPGYVKQYLVDLQSVRASSREVFSFPLSRGLTIFKL